jgi:hypothetical protein
MRLPARTTCIFALVLFIAIALDQNVARDWRTNDGCGVKSAD